MYIIDGYNKGLRRIEPVSEDDTFVARAVLNDVKYPEEFTIKLYPNLCDYNMSMFNIDSNKVI